MIYADVWGRLDPRTGLLSPRERRAATAVLGAIMVLAVIAAAGWRTGAVTPRLSQSSTGGAQYAVHKYPDGRPRAAHTTIDQTFTNNGLLPVTITGVSMQGADAALTDVSVVGGGALPRLLEPGASFTLTLGLETRRCMPADEKRPVLFEVQQWWGTTTSAATRADEDEPWLSFAALSLCS